MTFTILLAADLTWRPVMTPVRIFALAAILAALAAAVYARTLRPQPVRSLLLLAMRLAAIVTLALLLMGPSVVPPAAQEPARGKLTVMLDTSGSMLTEDAGGQPRVKYAVERWLGPAKLLALQKHFDVKLLGFDELPRPMTVAVFTQSADKIATGDVSRYNDSLRQVLMQTTGGDGNEAVLLIGDGHDTDDAPTQAALAMAKTRNIAVHTVAVGSATVDRDLALAAMPRQEYLMVNEPGQVVVNVYQVGADSASTTLHLRGEGVEEKKTVTFGGRASARAEFSIKRDKPGIYEYQISADPLEGEKVTNNNTHTVFIEVTARRIRVLVLEGEPYWDTKFIAQALRSDQRIELTTLTQVSEKKDPESIVTRRAAGGVTVPATAEQWAAYDVVILGRGIENIATPAAIAALDEHVASGGGHVIFARGRAYDPDTPIGQQLQKSIARLEPVTWSHGLVPVSEQVKLHMTPEGQAHPAFGFAGLPGGAERVLQTLPSLETAPGIDKIKPATKTLATLGPESKQPAVVTMNYGSGRVFAVLGEGLWRWGLLPPKLASYKGAFESFWSSVVRWIALGGDFQPGQDVALNLGRTSVRRGDPLNLDVLLKLPPPPGFAPILKLTSPDGQTQPISLQPVPDSPTRYTAIFEPRELGAWTAALDAPPLNPARQVKRFSVYDVNIERLRTDARPQVLRDMSEQTGGLHFTADQEADLAALLQRQRVSMIAPPQPRYAWDEAWIMALLLTWMGIEWIGRRSAGWL